jgi:bacillithiol biosynthesis deacetylase BshB1
LQEATRAAEIMGVPVRENLGMADGFFEQDETNLRKIITVIRRYQPEIILANAPEDRHPDHGRSAKLVSDAAFLSGLRKIITTDQGEEQVAWRPSYVFHYIQDRFIQPGFVIDISSQMDKKMEAILAYGSQFYSNESKEPATYISTPQFLETVKARAMMLGKRIGVTYAEGYISEKIIGLKSFDGIIQNVT